MSQHQHSDRLDTSFLELAGSDVDIGEFRLAMRDGAGIALESAITSAVVNRTVEGASSIEVQVDDDLKRTIQRSNRLGRKVDVNVDGLWWTFVGIKKAQRGLTLTFEEREVNVLRYYASFMKADRAKTTRAEFVLRMIKEVKEIQLQWVIPELKTIEPVSDLQPNEVIVTPGGAPLVNAKPSPTGQGIQSSILTGLTVKGEPATPEQVKNANIVLSTGQRMGTRVKVLVASIMTGITESSLVNLRGGDRDSVGIFQQRRSQGWPATRNVATDAAAFFKDAIQVDAQSPNLSLAMLCQSVQHSAFSDGSNYDQWQSEGEAFVREYGLNPLSAGNDPVSNNQQVPAGTLGAQYFTRGQITKRHGAYLLQKENSWACGQRLASEVNWRMFCVSGVIFFVSEQWLFKSKPFMTISEDTEGIDWIDYDYDEGKKQATIQVTAHLSRWSAPPGSIVEIKDMGIVDGKWLVNTVNRSLYETVGTITLKKPLPVLPEPVALSSVPQGFFGGDPNVGGARNGLDLPMGAIQKRVVAYANSQLGVPYQWGAEQKGVAFDCSGLAQAAYSYAGIDIPRVAQDQFGFGPVNRGQLQPGDLVFFGTASNIHHVGIYIGNGNMIDAPNHNTVVRVDPNFRNTWPDYYGATSPWRT